MINKYTVPEIPEKAAERLPFSLGDDLHAVGMFVLNFRSKFRFAGGLL